MAGHNSAAVLLRVQPVVISINLVATTRRRKHQIEYNICLLIILRERQLTVRMR